MGNGSFFGRLLRINLTEKTSSIENMDERMLTDYVGGGLLGAKLLYDELGPGVDPLGPENKLIYTVGPLTGTDAPCASRLNLTRNLH